jgi:hypothetical protein
MDYFSNLLKLYLGEQSPCITCPTTALCLIAPLLDTVRLLCAIPAFHRLKKEGCARSF